MDDTDAVRADVARVAVKLAQFLRSLPLSNRNRNKAERLLVALGQKVKP